MAKIFIKDLPELRADQINNLDRNYLILNVVFWDKVKKFSLGELREVFLSRLEGKR